jgi:hypothetical protein
MAFALWRMVAQWLKKSFGITVRRSNAFGLTVPESILVRADRVIQCTMSDG